jgi:hypothetical protein
VAYHETTDDWDVIHTYSRAQAIADGVLVAVDANLAAEAGLVVPVALTRAAWEDCVAWTPRDTDAQSPQDETGRLWDVLWMTRSAIKRMRSDGHRVDVELVRIPCDGQSHTPKPVTLIAQIGPGDNHEAVITIMQPHED